MPIINVPDLILSSSYETSHIVMDFSTTPDEKFHPLTNFIIFIVHKTYNIIITARDFS